jgi:ABC-type amino acid transport substrate-binding protein
MSTFAPHAMRKLDGTIEGFNVDMAMEIGKRLKRPVNIEGTQFSGLIPGLNAKKYDWIAAPTTVTPQRAEQMLFTEGYLDTDFQFLVKKSDAEINNLDELKGKTISVNKGSAYETWAKENMGKFGFKYDIYDTNADAVQAVLSGRAQANLAGNTVVAWAAKQNPKPVAAIDASTPCGSSSIATPAASSRSAAPHFDDAALLPCLHTGTPAAATTSADIVDTLTVLLLSPPVPTMSIARDASSALR